MKDLPNNADRMRSALVMVATIATIVFNGLAAAGLVNGVTPQAISERYETIITPAGYAFSIWSLIYLGMIAFSIYQLLPANLVRYRRVRTLYLISCVFNCGWIYFWHHDQIVVCFILISLLLATLLVILRVLRETDTLRGALLTKAPFGIYAGWVTAATLVNLSIMLVYLKVDLGSTGWVLFGVAAILAAGALAVIVRLKLNNYLYPMAIAWAATAIAVKQSGNTPIVVAAAATAVAGLVTAGSIVTKLKDSTSE